MLCTDLHASHQRCIVERICFKKIYFSYTHILGEIIGCRLSREEEDHLKLEVDQEIRAMRPTVSPNLCRYLSQ